MSTILRGVALVSNEPMKFYDRALYFARFSMAQRTIPVMYRDVDGDGHVLGPLATLVLYRDLYAFAVNLREDDHDTVELTKLLWAGCSEVRLTYFPIRQDWELVLRFNPLMVVINDVAPSRDCRAWVLQDDALLYHVDDDVANVIDHFHEVSRLPRPPYVAAEGEEGNLRLPTHVDYDFVVSWCEQQGFRGARQ